MSARRGWTINARKGLQFPPHGGSILLAAAIGNLESDLDTRPLPLLSGCRSGQGFGSAVRAARMTIRSGLPFAMHTHSGSLPRVWFLSGSCARNRAAYEPPDCLPRRRRTRGPSMSLVAGILLALLAVGARAEQCADAKANSLFVQAANLLQNAKDSSRKMKLHNLERARDKLAEITKKHQCTSLAVQLASEQRIGEISIAGLNRRIAILKKETPPSCRATPLRDAVQSALGIHKDRVRDSMIAAVARKLVRCEAFGCAQDLTELIDDKKQRENLRQNIVRAKIRADLKKQRCCFRVWP